MMPAIDPQSEVMRLCVLGTQAEYAGDMQAAKEFYRQAWEVARDDYEACIAAHYVARMQSDPAQTLYWNEVALAHAEAVADERAAAFYPSLYVNLGRSHELLGNMDLAQGFYRRATELGLDHDGINAVRLAAE